MKPLTSFLGSDDFSLAVLTALYQTLGRKLALVVTEPDKRLPRGSGLVANPIKSYAKQNRIEVVETVDSLTPIVSKIKNYDLAIVASFGRIIPINFFTPELPLFVNIHPSLLPRFRGSSPIQNTILSGDQKSGVTIIRITGKIDAGPIIAQQILRSYRASDSYSTLKTKLGDLAGKMAADLVTTPPPYLEKPQTKKGIVPAPKIKKTDGQINWPAGPQQIDRQIRAYEVWPKSYLIAGRRRLIIEQASASNNRLIIRKIKVAGKKSISGQEFARNYRALLTSFPKWVRFR